MTPSKSLRDSSLHRLELTMAVGLIERGGTFPINIHRIRIRQQRQQRRLFNETVGNEYRVAGGMLFQVLKSILHKLILDQWFIIGKSHMIHMVSIQRFVDFFRGNGIGLSGTK